MVSVNLFGCGDKGCDHSFSEWEETKAATCSEAGEAKRMCLECGETETEALATAGHEWVDATCTEAERCSVCGAGGGEALGHRWKNASCTSSGYCQNCGKPGETAQGHSWTDSNCTAPLTCSKCGITMGSAKGHAWVEATCEKAKHCSDCGETEGAALSHSCTVKNTDSAYIASGVPCQGTTKYYYSCTCGKKGSSTFTVTSERALHALNGQPIENDAVLDVNTPGVQIVAGQSIECGGTATGLFVCDICDAPQLITITGQHSYSGGYCIYCDEREN